MEELLGELIGQIITSLVFVAIGFAYLHVRFWNRRRVKAVLAKQYENSYANAGMAVMLNAVAGIGIALVLGLIVVAPLAHWLHLG